MAQKFKTCAVEGCKGNAHYTASGAKGYCSSHYQRLCRHGSPIGGGIGHGEAGRWLDDHVSYHGDDCLTWPYSRYPDGGGQVIFRGKPSRASRAMCILAHGEPKFANAEAAHSCSKGHEGCVNPRHLRWDTPKGNCADRAIHGTENRGQRQWMAKLTEDDVRQIRHMRGSYMHKEIAAVFGVSRQTVSDILAGRAWAWLD